jgi:site-specific DNA recombinase
MKAVGYVRVSTIAQTEDDKVSLDQQEADIRAYCEQKGYDLIQVYRDAGYSGASKNRPAFQQMLADIPNQAFNVLVCWKSDRLSRGLYPADALSEAIEGSGVTLESVKDVIDLNTFTLMAAVGRIELENLRQRAQMGRKGRVQRGHVLGKVVYGYRRSEDGKPEIVEHQATVIKRILDLYLSGHSSPQIADLFNR